MPKKPDKPKPLLTPFERRDIVETLTKKERFTAANLKWVHHLVDRALKRNKLKPYPD